MILGLESLYPNIRKIMNKFNKIHDGDPIEQPQWWNIQPPESRSNPITLIQNTFPW